jgi:hypothetical protein
MRGATPALLAAGAAAGLNSALGPAAAASPAACAAADCGAYCDASMHVLLGPDSDAMFCAGCLLLVMVLYGRFIAAITLNISCQAMRTTHNSASPRWLTGPAGFVLARVNIKVCSAF